jgi:electron transfer flavoprotein beta subunit
VNVVVLVKQVPDTWAERKLDASSKTLDRASVDVVMNEIDEYAVEEALRIKEAQGGEVTILTMGPERAVEAVHVTDEALAGSDAVQTSAVLAKVLETLEWDLVIAGSEATDSRMAIMGALLAERTGKPQLTGARKVTAEGGTVRIERQTENGYAVVEASTPAILSVVEKINEPRYPSFKGIMAAKSKPLTTVTLADTGLDAGSVGLASAPSQVVEFANKPPRQAGQVVKDEGDGGTKVAEFLASQKFV